MTWTHQLDAYIQQVETFLSHYLQTDGCVGQEKIVEAMRYSALAGGKRLRPADHVGVLPHFRRQARTRPPVCCCA